MFSVFVVSVVKAFASASKDTIFAFELNVGKVILIVNEDPTAMFLVKSSFNHIFETNEFVGLTW